MRTITLPLPQIAFIIGTRAALAAGVAFLAADRFTPQQRRKIGLSLIAFGAATTVPAARWVVRAGRPSARLAEVRSNKAFVGATRFPRKGDEPF